MSRDIYVSAPACFYIVHTALAKKTSPFARSCAIIC